MRREREEPVDETGMWTYEKRRVVFFRCNVCVYKEDQEGNPS